MKASCLIITLIIFNLYCLFGSALLLKALRRGIVPPTAEITRDRLLNPIPTKHFGTRCWITVLKKYSRLDNNFPGMEPNLLWAIDFPFPFPISAPDPSRAVTMQLCSGAQCEGFSLAQRYLFQELMSLSPSRSRMPCPDHTEKEFSLTLHSLSWLGLGTTN